MCAPSAASDIRAWLAGRSWGPVGPTALADCSCTHHCFEQQTCPALTLEMSPEVARVACKCRKLRGGSVQVTDQ